MDYAMFGFSERNDQPLVGSSTPVHVAAESDPATLSPGSGYFLVQLRNAQAVFRGPVWEQAKSLVVTSRACLRHTPVESDPTLNIQRSFSVEKNAAQRLGLSADLIHLTPASVESFSVAIEFIVDKQNRLSDVAGLINGRSLVAAVSVNPAAAAAAKAVGTISEKLLRTMLPQNEQQPILKFQADFNIVAGVQAGYYVVLASRDRSNELPETPRLKVRDDVVFVDGDNSRPWSWVLIRVVCTPARTRELADGAVWESKLRSAEAIAQRIATDPLARKPQLHAAFGSCGSLIQEAQVLLAHDANYLQNEAEKIIAESLERCRSRIFRSRVKGGGAGAQDPEEVSAVRALRCALRLDQDDPGEEMMREYAADVRRSLQLLGRANIYQADIDAAST